MAEQVKNSWRLFLTQHLKSCAVYCSCLDVEEQIC